MQFHEFRSWWDFHKTKLAQFGRQLSYAKQIEALKRIQKHGTPAEISQVLPGRNAENMDVYASLLENESKWYDSRRPYYKVYPCIVDAICKLKLEFNCPCPEVPEKTICIRFAENHEPKAGQQTIAALLVHSEAGYDTKTGKDKEVLFIQVTLKEKPDAYYWFYFDTNDPGMTIEECLNQFPAAVHFDPGMTIEECLNQFPAGNYGEVRKLATRIALTTCMIAQDPEIITRDVLGKHQERYDKETDHNWKEKAEDKAKNNGVFGWSIGKNIEVTPHFRRPHWALRYTGPKGSIPKVVPVRGCKVKEGKLTKVPTGHMTEDGTEVEAETTTANGS